MRKVFFTPTPNEKLRLLTNTRGVSPGVRFVIAPRLVWGHVAPFFVSALFVFFSGIPLAHAALGISPPFINEDHLVPGALYSQTIYLVQDQPNQDLPMKANVAISDAIKPWFTIDTGTEFVIPKGTRQFPVTITIQVPQHQPLGQYSGNISFASQPSSAGQVTIALGVNVAINLTVGTGIYEKYQAYLSMLDIEEGWGPRINVKFRNEGNIPESFDGATFELYDQFDTVRLAFLQKNTDFPDTPAFTTSEYTVEFQTDFHLGLGQYWGITTFFKQGKVVATQKAVFNVFSRGSLSGHGGKISQLAGLYWPYAVFTVVVVTLGFVFYRKRSLKKH